MLVCFKIIYVKDEHQSKLQTKIPCIWFYILNTHFVLNIMHAILSVIHLLQYMSSSCTFSSCGWGCPHLQAYWLLQRENLESGNHLLANDKYTFLQYVTFFSYRIQTSFYKTALWVSTKNTSLFEAPFKSCITWSCLKNMLCKQQLCCITLRKVEYVKQF